MNRFLNIFGVLLAMTTLLPAQDRVFKNSSATENLIELYSSEGCSSCPPAEAWMNRLQTAPGLWKDTFPVVFHVDYWDGLGWPDRFARAEFTQRQRDYAARLNQDSVYTPEFVANGREWRRSWPGGDAIPAGAAKTGELMLTVHEGRYSASFQSPHAKSPVLNIALLGFRVIVDVKRGENSGRKLEHDFVVLGFASIPMTAGKDGAFVTDIDFIKMSTDDKPGAIVAWISNPDGGIEQVTGGWLNPSGLTARR